MEVAYVEPPTCKAGGVTNWAKIGIIATHPNYGLPHVPVPGTFNGLPRMSCIFCGCWLEKENQ